MSAVKQTKAGVQALAWISGNWLGHLGEQLVEEFWSEPRHGSIENKVRLCNPDGIALIELMAIRESVTEAGQPTLTLHLRQFDETLNLLTSQQMQLATLTDSSVAFAASGDAKIHGLAYSEVSSTAMKIEVTLQTGHMVTAAVERC